MAEYTRAPHTGDEMTILRGLLDENRYMMLWKLENLDRDRASQPMVPSGTSLMGLVKHLARVERWWFVHFVGGKSGSPWSRDDPHAEWRIEDDDTIASVSADYEAAIAEADAVLDAITDLDVVREWSRGDRTIRWVVVHMIEETARHAGHADIIRELIDGTTGYLPDN